jgi:transposase-like protein
MAIVILAGVYLFNWVPNILGDDEDQIDPRKNIIAIHDSSSKQYKKECKVCRHLEISEQTYYRWWKQYGGMKISQAKRMEELERENGRLKKVVAELTLVKLILRNALFSRSRLSRGLSAGIIPTL